MALININIDGKEIKSHSDLTILEIAKANGIEIPSLCHDEKIKNFGSCGICVVEVAGNPRLVRSCSTTAFDGMIISTQSDRIKASRKTTLELLISDHTGDCKAPCSNGCPSKVDIQGYVGLIANKAYDEALQLIKEELPFPASIGRVCPHPCQTACRRGLVDDAIEIAWLKRYVADLDLAKDEPYIPAMKPSTGKKVAVIGGGPSGLSAAYYLKTEGHEVEVFEAMPEFGGMLKYGIPLYRLPKEVLLSEVKIIEKMGVKLTPNKRVGRDMTLEHIRAHHDAVYVSIGAWQSSKMDVPGESLDGVMGGIDFLTKFAVNEPVKTGNRIAIIGGGNTAMDACRTAKRLGAKEVYCIYRRTKEDMPATPIEIKEAEEEGIQFKFLLNPTEVVDNGNGGVSKLKLQKMEIVIDEKSGRRNAKGIEGSEEILEVDSVIVAIGQKLKNDGLEEINLNSRGSMNANLETFETNLKGVFAGGDGTNNGADIAIAAIADGKYAARAIHSYLNGNLTPQREPFYVKQDLKPVDLTHVEKLEKAHMGHEAPELRSTNFEEVVHGYTALETSQESNRCLECGCHDFFECSLVKQANVYELKDLRFEGDKHALAFKDDHSYIMRDPNKCILCGMCVRICDEITDQTALGLVNRGFETVVLPALEKKLDETTCISCGQCVSVCPTGALQEKTSIKKPVPLRETHTQTTCVGCSVGCQEDIASKGSLLLRALPTKDAHSVNNGLLCSRGRFGYDAYLSGERITQPMVRKDGQLVPVSLNEALLYVARRAQSIQLRYGNESVGISVSDRYTLEDMYMIKSFAKKMLDTDQVFSFNKVNSGLKKVFGADTTSNRINELANTEMIWTVGIDPIKENSILGFKIKEAVNKGAKLMHLNDEATKLDRFANWKGIMKPDSSMLYEILKAIVEGLTGVPKGVQADELEKLKANLTNVTVSEAAANFAHQLVHHRQVLTVYDASKVTVEAEIVLSLIGILTGHIDQPRNGLIKLRANMNSQGLEYMNIKSFQDYADDQGKVPFKAMLIFGENVSLEQLGDLEFLMVQDTHMSEVALKADVVLPKAVYLETSGHVVSMDRAVLTLQQIFNSPVNCENWEMMKALMNVYGTNCDFQSADKVYEAICLENSLFNEMNRLNQEVLEPLHKAYNKGTSIYHIPELKIEPSFQKKTDTNVVKTIFEARAK